MYFIGDEEIAALKKLFEKKRFYRYQSDYVSECDSFEAEFSKYTSVSHSLLLSSGTNALIVSLLSAGIQPGDEVLIPTYTFVATATAVLQAGAIPVLVNIDSELSLDLAEAQNKISDKTKALILVHMDGLVANIKAAQEFCKKNKLIFIEDVAQAIGASFENKKLGSFGDFGCYSLNENKHISCGEGGILVTQTRAHYEKAFCLHDGAAQFNPTKKDFFTEIKPFVGMSTRVSEIQGAIMRVQLGRLDFILSELRQRKDIFVKALSELKGIRIVKGYSTSGECASSVHLQFSDPEAALLGSKKVREAGVALMPVTSRPAHASWKWSHLLGEPSHIQSYMNPYKNSDKKYSYPVANSLQSVDILTRTCKFDISLEKTLVETQDLANNIKSALS